MLDAMREIAERREQQRRGAHPLRVRRVPQRNHGASVADAQRRAVAPRRAALDTGRTAAGANGKSKFPIFGSFLLTPGRPRLPACLQVRPNPGFWRALVAYERELRPGLPPSLPSQGAVLEGWLLMSESPMAGAGAPLWEPRWVEVCTICGAPRGAEARGVHGGLTGADPFVVYEESQRDARRSPAFALGGELLVYSSSTSFTPLMAIPLSRARLGIDMKGQWSAGHECWTLHAPAVGAAALPPMPEEEVQKEDMQEVVHARPPRVVLFAAASREESMSWLQACAERGATLEALALASLDRDCDCECVRSFLPPDI